MLNTNVLVQIKRLHENAILPEYKTSGASGFDLSSVGHFDVKPGETRIIATGWAMEVPSGYEIQIRPRSGVSTKTNLRVVFGTIDSDYTGEVGIIVQNVGTEVETIPYGMRVAQGVLNQIPRATFMPVSELHVTDRGNGGFGSTSGF